MLRSIIPRDEVFFQLFDRLGDRVVEAAGLLATMMDAGAASDTDAAGLKAVEHAADEVVHETQHRLHRTFVTPIDRLDIHRLVTSLDDIVDLSHGAGSRLALYRPKHQLPEAAALAHKLVAASRALREMVGLLASLSSSRSRLMELVVAINTTENEADVIRREGVARLLADEADPFEFIKWKEILDLIEEAVDHCEDVADIVEGIVLQHS